MLPECDRVRLQHMLEWVQEARRFAAEFIGRLAGRHPDNEPLQLAVEPDLAVVEAMNRVVQLFPFPGKAQQTVQDPITIDEACAALRDAQAADTRATEAMEAAVAAEWAQAEPEDEAAHRGQRVGRS